MGTAVTGWYTPRSLKMAVNHGCECVVRVFLLQATSDKPYDLNCEICGSTMIERSCKIKCPNCGFTRDCSDP